MLIGIEVLPTTLVMLTSTSIRRIQGSTDLLYVLMLLCDASPDGQCELVEVKEMRGGGGDRLIIHGGGINTLTPSKWTRSRLRGYMVQHWSSLNILQPAFRIRYTSFPGRRNMAPQLLPIYVSYLSNATLRASVKHVSYLSTI